MEAANAIEFRRHVQEQMFFERKRIAVAQNAQQPLAFQLSVREVAELDGLEDGSRFCTAWSANKKGLRRSVGDSVGVSAVNIGREV